FIDLLQTRDAVPRQPSHLLDDFAEAEAEAYRSARTKFDTDSVYRYSLDDPKFVPEDGDRFMSWEEFTRYREVLDDGYAGDLCDVFTKLLKQPTEESIEPSMELMTVLNAMNKGGLAEKAGTSGGWHGLTPYWKWALQLYAPGRRERLGGWNVVVSGL